MTTVTVLMATFNGRRYLPEQLSSILNQQGVEVRVVVSDDGSADGTFEWLEEQAAVEPRISLLDFPSPSGSSAANFYRLLARADLDGADFVALSDQDDIWLPGKLEDQVAQAMQYGADGVSSSVTAFTASGRRTLIRKNYPQRECDYLTESPGPGCSFLMTPRLAGLVREVLATQPLAHGADFHDSLIYAVARAHGLRWHIGGKPTVDYRQHDGNVMGSNSSAAGAVARWKMIRQQWHRNQAIVHARVAIAVASDENLALLERMLVLLTARGFAARWHLSRRTPQLRRRPRDRAIMRLLILAGVW